MRLLPALLQTSFLTSVLAAPSLGPRVRAAVGERALLAPTVDVATANPGADIERSACVTVAIRPNVGYECGDLRLTYALPTIRTFNDARSVTMLYNSQHAKPTPIVRAWVTNPAGGSTPTTVIATLFVLQGGSYVQRASQTWGVTGWTPGSQRQVALSFDATDHATGLYPYRLEVGFSDGGAVQMTPATGELAIVNRSSSEFGPGWWVAGYERVIPQPNGDVFWVGGDGSTRRYVRQPLPDPVTGHTVYRARALAGVDSVTWMAQGYYYRHLAHAAHVRFAASGRHDLTRSRLGRDTHFYSYYCDRLDGISLPVPDGQQQRAWQFYYTLPNPANACEGQAVVGFIGASGASFGTWRWTQRVLSTSAGAFVDYATGAQVQQTTAGGRVATYADVRGTTTTFTYGVGGLLTSARTPVSIP